MVKMNFQSDKKFSKELWTCWDCSALDSQLHIVGCSQYSHLRQNLDMNNDADVVKYFQDVIKYREDKK